MILTMDREAPMSISRQTPAQRLLTTLLATIEQFQQSYRDIEAASTMLLFSEEGRESVEQLAICADLIGFLAMDLRALPARGTLTRRRMRETLASHAATAAAEYQDWRNYIEAAEAQGRQTIYVIDRWLQVSAAKRRAAILLNYVAALAALQAITNA